MESIYNAFWEDIDAFDVLVLIDIHDDARKKRKLDARWWIKEESQRGEKISERVITNQSNSPRLIIITKYKGIYSRRSNKSQGESVYI